ncbi:MAG TPA: ribonuclease P protein component [Anaeromyxobacteraceae bacterium]|nr:ribonuclease P protein component [Anaeromyxobacteraceae bacterium]
MRLGKETRLRRRGEFVAVKERGKRLHAGAYLVLGLENGLNRARLGVSVSTRQGNAVVRNRIKRWVREAFRRAARDLVGLDVVVIARGGAGQGGLPAATQALGGARTKGEAR